MHTYCLRLAGFWLVATLALASNQVWAAEKGAVAPPPKAGSIVKWVDEKGVTHYGDTMPPEYSTHGHSELNRQGHVVKPSTVNNSQASKVAAEAETKASVEQKRHDSALLAAYTTEQEFDLARDRNLETDQAAVEGLNQRMATAKERMAASQKIADGFKQRKKPVPDFVAQDLKEDQNEIAKVETQIAARQKSMDETRQRFEKDKQRFIQLKINPNAPPPVETPPVTAPAAGSTPATSTPVATVAPPASTAAAPATKPLPVAEKPAAAPAVAKPAPAPVGPVTPVAAKPTTTPAAAPVPAPTAAAAKPAAPAAASPAKGTASTAKPVKKIKRVVMP